MRRCCPSGAALLTALLSGIIAQNQAGSTTLMDTNLSSSSTQPAALAGRPFGTDGESITDAGERLRSLAEVSASVVYLEPSSSDSKSKTKGYFPGSTDTQPTVTSQTHGHLNEEGFNVTETTGLTVPLSDLPVGGASSQNTATLQADWVMGTSLPIQNTAVETVSHTSLKVTTLPLSDNSPRVRCEAAPPVLLPTSGDDGDSPEIAGPSEAEILAMAIGSFTITALVSSLSYQLVVFIRRKKNMVKRNCSVYVIENQMHKYDLEANDLEPETKL